MEGVERRREPRGDDLAERLSTLVDKLDEARQELIQLIEDERLRSDASGD